MLRVSGHLVVTLNNILKAIFLALKCVEIKENLEIWLEGGRGRRDRGELKLHRNMSRERLENGDKQTK